MGRYPHAVAGRPSYTCLASALDVGVVNNTKTSSICPFADFLGRLGDRQYRLGYYATRVYSIHETFSISSSLPAVLTLRCSPAAAPCITDTGRRKSGAFSGLPAVLTLRCFRKAAAPLHHGTQAAANHAFSGLLAVLTLLCFSTGCCAYITDPGRRRSGAFSGLPLFLALRCSPAAAAIMRTQAAAHPRSPGLPLFWPLRTFLRLLRHCIQRQAAAVRFLRPSGCSDAAVFSCAAAAPSRTQAARKSALSPAFRLLRYGLAPSFPSDAQPDQCALI